MKALLDWRVGVAVLAAAGVVVYGPALNRIFAADQIWYFAELGGESTLSAGLRHLDYNTSREFWKGDELLFRPVTFGWLAVANWAFSYHHAWWNIATLVIHIAVAIGVFRLLLTLRPSPLALPAAVLFLVFEASMELVVWNHLGGYLLAWLGLIIGLRAFVLILRGSSNVLTFVVSFTVAALAYELMVVVAGFAAVMLVMRGRQRLTRGQKTLLFSPVLTFVLLYAIHAVRASRLAFVDSGVGEPWSLVDHIVDLTWRSGRLLAAWTRELLLPTALQLGGNAGQRFWKSFELSWTDPLQLLNGVVVLATLALVATAISRKRLRGMAPVLFVLVVAALVYPLLITAGRREGWVVATTYYAYPFGLLCVIGLYTAIDEVRLATWRGPLLATLVWVFAGIHACGTWHTAWEIEWWNRAPSAFFTRVEAFVDQHRSEPGFSFRIDPHPEDIDPPVILLVGHPDEADPEMRLLRMSEIIFGRHYDAVAPMYVLSPTGELSERYTAR